MDSIAEPMITRLEAFDANGFHCGHALYRATDGRWLVTAGKMVRGAVCRTQDQARSILQMKGAALIAEYEH